MRISILKNYRCIFYGTSGTWVVHEEIKIFLDCSNVIRC